jgi:hypothetical protein
MISLRGKGMNFDTGFLSAGTSTREPFDPEVVRREMRIIREDLHCTAVRITGGDPDRLEIAAQHAADAGLAIWFCPFTNGLTEERLALVSDPLRVRPLIGEVRTRVNAVLRRAVEVVRARFGGPVSYASLPLEGVDWSPFDIIASDAVYRSAATAANFRDLIRAYVAQGRAQGKPVAVTEFGCMTYRGAADVASDIHTMVEWGDDGRPARLKEAYVRDEAEQATYLRELLDVFDTEGVDAAFVYTFARYDLPHRADPQTDLDRVSRGIVKVLDPQGGAGTPRDRRYPDMPWEPKAAFDALAECYA